MDNCKSCNFNHCNYTSVKQTIELETNGLQIFTNTVNKTYNAKGIQYYVILIPINLLRARARHLKTSLCLRKKYNFVVHCFTSQLSVQKPQLTGFCFTVSMQLRIRKTLNLSQEAFLLFVNISLRNLSCSHYL
jgi:hypothetical protein